MQIHHELSQSSIRDERGGAGGRKAFLVKKQIL